MEKTFQLVDKPDLVKVAGGKWMTNELFTPWRPSPCPFPRPLPVVKDISAEDMVK